MSTTSSNEDDSDVRRARDVSSDSLSVRSTVGVDARPGKRFV